MSERRRRERVSIPAGAAAIPVEFRTEFAAGTGKVVRVGESGLVIRADIRMTVPIEIGLVLNDASGSKLELTGVAQRSSAIDEAYEVYIELDVATDSYQDLFERLLHAAPGGVDAGVDPDE